MEEYLYHYTNVETLAMILSNKTIRFNSLEDVDDLQEKETSDLKGLGKLVFVSCWTEDGVEQIPMWKMYGSIESGVRIKMRKYPFKEKEFLAEGMETVAGDKKTVGGGNRSVPGSLLSIAETMKMGILPPGPIRQNEILHKVIYTDDKSKLYPKILSRQEQTYSVALGDMGKYKNLGWSFQKEWRYIVHFIPFDYSNSNPCESFCNSMNGILKNTAIMPFTHFDCEIEERAFSEMEITLSPKISAGNKVIVNALAEKYNPGMKVVESSFKGLIA